LIVVGVLAWILSSGGVATADIYADSAHGNAPDGVNRSGTGYDIGSCAHCHDTFDPTLCGDDLNGLMLFAANDNPTPIPQEDNFCFECHKGSGSVQVRDGGLKNHTYSTNFGGGTATLTTIYDAFNASGSSHNLSDVLNHAVGRGIGFTDDMNPCLVCHDHHAAQQNYPVTSSGLGGVKTAIRMPYTYASDPTELFGDEIGGGGSGSEIISDYTAKYQAPYYKNGGGKYEPANNDISNGDNLPNFRRFCINNCHGNSDVTSTDHGPLIKIDWANKKYADYHTGDQHGKWHESGVWEDGDLVFQGGYTVAPYGNESYNYVLSCTDCHESHGSSNEWLLRTCVNGKDNITMEWPGDWWDFCTACHVLTTPTYTYHAKKWEAYSPKCPVCHEHRNDPNHENHF
jgi:hypothetical protein